MAEVFEVEDSDAGIVRMWAVELKGAAPNCRRDDRHCVHLDWDSR
jgi:hypothetical protein